MQRIILYGPPLAGKTTLLKAFANSRRVKMYQFDPLEGATEEQIAAGLPVAGYGRDVVERGLRVYDESTDVGFATIWGPFWNTNAWPRLLARADAVLLALDPQVMREAVDNDCLENVNALPQQLSGCVVWTKQDLVEAGAEIVSPQLIDRGVVGRWPVFRSRHDEPATLLKPIEHLLSKLTNT